MANCLGHTHCIGILEMGIMGEAIKEQKRHNGFGAICKRGRMERIRNLQGAKVP